MDANLRRFQIADLDVAGRAISLDWSSSSSLRQDLMRQANFARSGGPWLVFNTDQAIFDGVNAGYGLGYNAGPLFGTAQYSGAWSGNWLDSDVQAVQQAFDGLIERKPKWKVRKIDFSTPRELIRNYISTNILEQFEGRSLDLGLQFQDLLEAITRRRLHSHSGKFLTKTRIIDRKLICQFENSSLDPIRTLARHGVLAACDSEGTVEIEIPLSSTNNDIELLTERLINAWLGESPTQSTISLRDYKHYYNFHAQLIRMKQMVASGQPLGVRHVTDTLEQLMPPDLREVAELRYLTKDSWPKHRTSVDELQKQIYEPARQTSLATFDQLYEDDFGYGLLVLVEGQIAGMASAGPLALFPGERGTLADPDREDRHVIYPLDLTVAEPFRGSLGTYLKRGIVLLGLALGHRALHGRNRDRLAAAMWAINLSLGSYQIRHLPDDYPDTHQFRDCIYYRCPIRWSEFEATVPSAEGLGVEQAIARLLYY